jgi:cell division protein FtsB
MHARSAQRMIFRIGLIVIFGTTLFFLARATWNIYEKNMIARKERNESKMELETLEERYSQISQDVERLVTERGLEEEIRSKFQVSKPGEHTIVLLDPEKEKKVEEKKNIWQKIKDLFQ